MTDLPCKKSDVEFIVWKDAVSQWTRGQMEEATKLTRRFDRRGAPAYFRFLDTLASSRPTMPPKGRSVSRSSTAA